MKAKSLAEVFIAALLTVVAGLGIFALISADTTGRDGSGLGPRFEYDLDSLRKIDPALVTWEETREAKSFAFPNLRAVAAGPDGRAYVAGAQVVVVLDKDGNELERIELDEQPTAVAVGEDGVVFVATGDYVRVYDADQEPRWWPRPADDALLVSLAVGPADVFAADAVNKVVYRYSRDGKKLGEIGRADQRRNIPGLVVPSPYLDVAIGRDGLLRVVNPGRQRIEAYTFEGDLEFWWGEAGVSVGKFSGCCNPASMAMLPDGGFITAEKGLARVVEFDANGGFVGVVAADEQWEDGLLDVAVDGLGRVLVLERISRKMHVFSRKCTENRAIAPKNDP